MFNRSLVRSSGFLKKLLQPGRVQPQHSLALDLFQRVLPTDKPKISLQSYSSSRILTHLSSISSEQSALTSNASTSYISPYSLPKPLDAIVFYNRSKNAANFAIRQLKDAWPNLSFIHVVQDDRDPIPGSDGVVRISNWASMTHFKAQFDEMVATNPALRRSMMAGKVGFYCGWSAQAENSAWALAAQKAGFVWIGASPDKMKGLDKIEYKKLCQEKGLPTADFIEISPPQGVVDKEEAFTLLAKSLVSQYQNTPALAGKPIFVKHNEGGGGRGTKKVTDVTFDNAVEAIRKIVNETGGNLEGVYAELALDLEGAQLFQLEIEWDKSIMAQGGRLVWFNKENQKVLEVGFTDTAIAQMLPKNVYDDCRAASKIIFEASGYDSRGTNEILIIKDNKNNWSYKLLELNKRIQVENEALSEAVVDKNGHASNVPAEQVMRALGYPAPSIGDFRERGPAIVAHVRLLSCEITPTGSRYHHGLEIEGALYPQGANVQYVKGPVYLDADPQIGRALITAHNWPQFCDKLLQFAQEFQFFGPKTECSTYFDFLRKLAADSSFRAGTLGCNNTFNVLANAPVEKSKTQKIVEALFYTVTPLVTHGYRPKEGVKDQRDPNRSQLKEFVDFMEGLRYETTPQTPFSRLVTHLDWDRYIQELKDVLANHGGGTVTVIRDVLQSSGDQESALVQGASAKLAQMLFAGSGVGIGFEVGGAQYQAGLMRKFDWMTVLTTGLLTNLPSLSLTRSKWMNGLTPKSREEQAFIFHTIAKAVRQKYGLALDAAHAVIPWTPNNFHAGNHPEQDITTREMLRANFPAIPNWAWDPRYTDDHFKGWVTRQIDLFAEEGKPLHQIRIKNPGQGPLWRSEVIVHLVQIIRQMFRDRGLNEPIIYIHNHEFNGMAAHIGARALKKCQQLGYALLVVDSAPPGTSHNSNLIVSESLVMSLEQREQLKYYNRGAHLMLNLPHRFNNQNITKANLDPNWQMAGGTTSSDLADAIKMGIPTYDMNTAIALARELTGLGTPVTPYSEWIKQIGFAIWKNDDIQPKTLEAVQTYINNGGQLAIATAILEGLREWKTLLPRPDIMNTLLKNHGVFLASAAHHQVEKPPLDIKAKKAWLQEKLSNIKVTDRVLSTVVGFDKIGLESLEHRDHSTLSDGPRDMTVMMESPEFVYSRDKQVGDTFTLYGEKITITNIRPNAKTGSIDIDYKFQGQMIRVMGIDPKIHANHAVSQVRYLKDKTTECAAPMAGKITGFFVQKGSLVKPGQKIATLEAMKMEQVIKADLEGEVDTLAALKMVEGGEVILTVRPQKSM